jgi:hypothetical protein
MVLWPLARWCADSPLWCPLPWCSGQLLQLPTPRSTTGLGIFVNIRLLTLPLNCQFTHHFGQPHFVKCNTDYSAECFVQSSIYAYYKISYVKIRAYYLKNKICVLLYRSAEMQLYFFLVGTWNFNYYLCP